MKNSVSVIIVNWNGRRWLQDCLTSLRKQDHKNLEVIFVDNASADDSVQFVEENFPAIKVVQTHSNLGFAGGNNAGYKFATGEFIFLLNNDTILPSNLISGLVKAFDELPKAGLIQPKIRLMRDNKLLDACGAYWTSTAFLYHYGIQKDASLAIYNKPLKFFSIKGAAVMIKREVIEKVGFFDGDFWCYYEETDLCHRAWLRGYESWYYPKVEIQHAMGGTSLTFGNDYIQFHNFKNKLLSILKNFNSFGLLRWIPIYIALNVLLSLFWLFSGKFRHFLALYKAMWWNLIHLPQTVTKRRSIQSTRVLSDRQIYAATKKNPRLNYYYCLLIGKLGQYRD
jgi:GT2 family glycosyltransferase